MDVANDKVKNLRWLMEPFVAYILIVLLGCVGGYLALSDRKRAAEDVLEDLEPSEVARMSGKRAGLVSLRENDMRSHMTDKYGAIGLFEEVERRRYAIYSKVFPFLFAGMVLMIKSIFASSTIPSTLALLVASLSIGYLIQKAGYRKRKAQHIRNIEFFLPVVMERIVMAVQAGLDIIPALKAIMDLDAGKSEGKGGFVGSHRQKDPVTRLLGMVVELTESGLGFEESLRSVAENIGCVALKHSFIHLAVAQKEGGEIIGPLKELSDSTQLYYQDSIEEEIAKMPVKATMPLLCTFAGLIICFITSPLIQILTIGAKTTLK